MPARITVTVDQQAVKTFLTSPSGPVYQFVDTKAKAVSATARNLCPPGNGTLSGSIGYTMYVAGSMVYAQVGSRLPYAVYVHEGTGIYGPKHTYITPVHGKYLVFTPGGTSMGVAGEASGSTGSTGGTVFAKKVKGIPASLFLYRAMLQELQGWPVQRVPLSG